MNAYEIAEGLKKYQIVDDDHGLFNRRIQVMLIEQADRIQKLERVLKSIANETLELSHDKIRWQAEDHIRWAKEVFEKEIFRPSKTPLDEVRKAWDKRKQTD